ncbi:hypothetical protein DXG03_003307 [Asterophora parasitica]|uniref:Uncharacterized protein n=1 Tax=Asterophora parasitica TaxID=117018 RepID=A0A9P7GFT4_9AGAR|nr:hypothetical protein DXG03_003307 [Asterophora parasitica]
MDEKTMILDVQELVEGEIWSVELSSSMGKEVIYVLECTCEVVGHPPAPHVPELDGKTAALDPYPLRADWSVYISQCLSSLPRPPSLMEHLKWTNHEEYDRGISKLWLSRTQGEGDIGAAKRLVAERYILACVVGNRWGSHLKGQHCIIDTPRSYPIVA